MSAIAYQFDGNFTVCSTAGPQENKVKNKFFVQALFQVNPPVNGGYPLHMANNVEAIPSHNIVNLA